MLSRISLVFFGVVVGVLLSEGLVRLLDVAPTVAPIETDLTYGSFGLSDDPVLRYVPKPGRGDINDAGFRGPLRTKKKPRDTFRIAVLGDSVSFGWCKPDIPLIALEKIYPTRLERLLNEDHPSGKNFEVLNFAVSGYDTFQEVRFFERFGLEYELDLVISQFFWNDFVSSSWEFWRLEKEEGFSEQAKLAREISKQSILKSHLARFLWYRSRLVSEHPSGGAPVGEYPNDLAPKLGYERLAQLSREHGFRVLVAVFPDFHHPEHPAVLSYYRNASQLASGNGFAVLNLFSALRSASPDNPRRVYGRRRGAHPDEFGHEATAKGLHQYLSTSNLVR